MTRQVKKKKKEKNFQKIKKKKKEREKIYVTCDIPDISIQTMKAF